MLLSAYVTALFEVIVHEHDEKKIKSHIKTVTDFFIPGWLDILGMN